MINVDEPVRLKQEERTSPEVVSKGMVSVIIPCYKQAGYLKEAISSVLEQTYPHFEILVVDDGSPDNVEEVVREFTQVKLIRQANQGAAVARNNGMLASKGAYLIFLDADDRLLPNALEAGVSFLTENPGCAYVSGLVQLIDVKGDFIEIPSQPKVEKEHFKTLLRSNYIWTPGVVMYRSAIFASQHGFDRHAGGSADYEINIRIARTQPIGCHGQVILEYRQHGANMSGNLAYMLKSGVRVRRAGYNYVKHDPGLLKAWRAGIQIVQDDVGKRLIKQIKANILNGAPGKGILKDGWYVLKYYPKGVPKLIRAKLRRLVGW
ncbi:glycosyltransferase family 2 protein [Botryobacter ruber]|uniref:glycosyltransferase family 2 protein n=1 Tax=Botryobacter ruber TaxID=2171629 RepID=UPI000E0A8C29|nr:glycosyltransferase [Botryobacter ruber]